MIKVQGECITLKNLKYLRESRGLSQQKLAELLGTTTQQNIQRYEAGQIEPDFEMLQQFADFFDTSIDFLINHTEISTKIEKIEKYALTIEEEKFIDKLRELPPEYRFVVDGMLSVLQEKLK